ncbi:MAG: hypothetical protein HC880_21280 [Bacteroidia bacterium]|nr:hypothetical protein [Bacteroidia bacterium]
MLGANLNHIVHLLSKDFVRLLLLAIAVAIPVAYYFSQQWLQNFVYKIDLPDHWYIFLASGLVALLINLVVVLFQALRASLINPVEVLKEE